MNLQLENRLFDVNAENFEALALEVFRFQAFHNEVYREYVRILGVNPLSVKRIVDIPFFPISFFKSQQVVVQGIEPEAIFSSSGTSGSATSKHHVASLNLYQESFLRCFHLFYGKPNQYCFLALLPSYLEREGSSLVYMTKTLIDKSSHSQSGFFLDNLPALVDALNQQENSQQPTILLGVTYALIELAKQVKLNLKNTIVMETGGMKGRIREMVRPEVHEIIKASFGVNTVHSEYGMTELLSQAYSLGDGIFGCPPWMRVIARDPYDPLCLFQDEGTGGLNIVDLANIYSCSFIQTDDIGVVHANGTFEVTGRLDGSQIRGCNLLV